MLTKTASTLFFAIAVAFALSSAAGASELSASLVNGTYVGTVPTGTSTVMPCTVTIESHGPFAKKISIASPRLQDPMVWSFFWIAGGEHQLNNFISGSIDITLDSSGKLGEVQMQYELAPSLSPFNTSTVNEYCVSLQPAP